MTKLLKKPGYSTFESLLVGEHVTCEHNSQATHPRLLQCQPGFVARLQELLDHVNGQSHTDFRDQLLELGFFEKGDFTSKME